jgi:2-hydroxychromene-2-carboxylate isomerase
MNWKELDVDEAKAHKKSCSKDTLVIKKKDLYKAVGIIAVLLVIVAVSAIWIGKNGITGLAAVDNYSGEKVKLEFYVMSQCPYGTQVLDAVAPVLKELGRAVDFEVNYIADDAGSGQFSSLHGDPEVKGDIVQLCAAKYNPKSYMDMIVCMDEDASSIPGNWEKCAKNNGLDTVKIKACYEGEEGKELLSASIKKSEEAEAYGSPTIYLNGKSYPGGRTSADFLRAICNSYSGDRPGACSDIPAPKKVMAVVLNDERCGEDCDMGGLMAALESIFPGLEVIELDYSSSEGKKLYKEAGLAYLPAILFDESVKEGEGYSDVESYLDPAGDYTSLRIGAVFDPTKEICSNSIDDTGDGKIDCDDPDCEGNLVCREEKKADLQVFIMSDCPYGKLAVEALKEVADNFGDSITYEVHYIAGETVEGFTSLHGTYESDEDIIQLCVKEKSPEQWLDYIYCRSIEGISGNDWKGCADTAKVDVSAVQACFDGEEGKELLRQDIRIADSLGIGASPTWLANNKYAFGGIDAETVKTGFCLYNLELAGCSNTLSSDTGGVDAGQC